MKGIFNTIMVAAILISASFSSEAKAINWFKAAKVGATVAGLGAMFFLGAVACEQDDQLKNISEQMRECCSASEAANGERVISYNKQLLPKSVSKFVDEHNAAVADSESKRLVESQQKAKALATDVRNAVVKKMNILQEELRTQTSFTGVAKKLALRARNSIVDTCKSVKKKAQKFYDNTIYPELPTKHTVKIATIFTGVGAAVTAALAWLWTR